MTTPYDPTTLDGLLVIVDDHTSLITPKKLGELVEHIPPDMKKSRAAELLDAVVHYHQQNEVNHAVLQRFESANAVLSNRDISVTAFYIWHYLVICYMWLEKNPLPETDENERLNKQLVAYATQRAVYIAQKIWDVPRRDQLLGFALWYKGQWLREKDTEAAMRAIGTALGYRLKWHRYVKSKNDTPATIEAARKMILEVCSVWPSWFPQRNMALHIKMSGTGEGDSSDGEEDFSEILNAEISSVE